MTTRGQINSNFYQIVNVDSDGNPTDVKPEYVPESTNANYANYAGTAYSVAGANVSGTVANANYSAYSGNATHANISDSANSVAVANVSGIGNIATINLTGSSSNVLYGNGVFAPATGGGGNGTPGGSNTYVQFNNSGAFDGVAEFTFNTSTNTLAATNFSGNGALLTNITGANVSGTVANANYSAYAGNVTVNAQPNITSLGNLVDLQFNNTVTPVATPNIGQMFWDTGEHTVTLGMENGVKQQIGLESYIYVKASSAITNGQVVMFTGATGDNVQAAPANVAVAGFRAGYILGVATQDIANNGFGYITSFGQVHGLNTNAYTVGDLLWLDPTTVGGLTATQPSAPNYQIQIATVTKKSGGDGHLQIIIRPEPKLQDISDVTITTPTTGQALIYNGSNVWINGNPNVANYAGSANTAATVTTNAQPNITSTGTLTTLSVSNNVTATRFTSNVATGTAPFTVTSTTTVANLSVASATSANSATTAGTVTTAAQPNITSFGTLTGLTSNGIVNFSNSTNVSLGGVSTVRITGGTNGYVLQTDGSGNLSWTAQTGGGGGNIAGANTQVQYNNAGVFGASAAFTFNSATNTVSSTNITATANITSADANLGNAATANYFIGRLYGAANSATSATTAGTVTTAAQPNITSTGTLVSLTVSGTIFATANTGGVRTRFLQDSSGSTTLVLGNAAGYSSYPTDTIAIGNLTVGYSGTSDLRVLNNANVGNALNAVFVNGTYLSGDGSNITNLSGGTSLVNGNSNVIVAANSSITMSVAGNSNVFGVNGTNAYVNGNLSASNATLGNLATANYLAGTLTTAAQPNITSLGTLSSLNVALTGNIVAGNANIQGVIYGNTVDATVMTAGYFVSNATTGTAPFTVTSTTTVANLSVANATYATTSGSATTAGTVTTAAQPNITSLGTLSGLSVTATITGNISGSASTVTTAAQPNITSTGNLTSLTVTGNLSAGNIASAGLGNVANVLFTKYNETVVAGGSTGAATLTPNAAAGTIYNYTLTGNITLSTLSNAVAGTSMVIILTQDGSGNRLLTSTMKFAGGSKTLSTAAGAIDIMSVFYDGSTYYATLSKGYA